MPLQFSCFQVLWLTVGEQRTGYYLSALPSDFGLAFKLEKFGIEGGEIYHVNLDTQTGNHSCECLGHVKHGHKIRCKHVASLLALRGAGKLA
jgi:hypothetical protein